MPAASYVGFKNNKCTLKFMHNWNDPTMLTLGLNFFENYYTVFDIANSQIGLVESIYSKNESNKEESLSWAKASLTLMQQTADKASEYKEGLIVMSAHQGGPHRDGHFRRRRRRFRNRCQVQPVETAEGAELLYPQGWVQLRMSNLTRHQLYSPFHIT